MADKGDAFFKQLATRGYEPLLHRVTGTYEFDIVGGRRWLVRVDAGKVQVSEVRPGPRPPETADCKVVWTAEELEDILQGKQDIVTDYMQGRIEITGNVPMAAAFQHVIVGATPAAPAR